MSSLVRSRRALGIAIALTLAVAAVAAYLVLTAGPARAKEFATLRVLAGVVEVRDPGSEAFAAAADGDTLREGDTVRTGNPGRAEIEYFDGSITRLDDGTTFDVVELSSDPDVAGNKVIRGKQSSGTTLNRVVKLTDSQSRFDVETPTAVASVRGTRYAVMVNPDGTTEYWVIEGLVALLLANGETLTLRAGEGVQLDADGTPGEIFAVDVEDTATLCELDETLCITAPPDEVLGETATREDGDDPPPTTIVVEPSTTSTTSTTTNDDEEGDDSNGGGSPPPGDTTPPESSIDSGPEGEQEKRSGSFAFSSNEQGTTFECAVDDGEYEPCESPYETEPQPDGEHTFRLRARDKAGNVGAEKTQKWTVSAPPETAILAGPDNSIELTDTAVFRVTSDEPNSSFSCRLEGTGDFEPCPTGEPVTRSLASVAPSALDVVVPNLTDGPHTIEVVATDETGKSDETPATRSWSVEAADPETYIRSAPDAESDSTEATFVLGSNEAGVTFECAIDTEVFSECLDEREVVAAVVDGDPSTLTVTYPNLEEGGHSFMARATDVAGNIGSPAFHTWTIDLPRPNTVIDGGPSGEGNGSTATFSFHSEPEGGSFECSLNNESFSACESGITYTNLTTGSYTFQVRATLGDLQDPTPAVQSWHVGDPSAISIALTWPGPPRDLDLHVETPSGAHIYYGSLSRSGTSGPWISLDRDMQEANARNGGTAGSETVSIYTNRQGFEPGSYKIWIANYWCDQPLTGSGASVTLSGRGVSQSFAVPVGTSTANRWDLGSISIPASGNASVTEDGMLSAETVFSQCFSTGRTSATSSQVAAALVLDTPQMPTEVRGHREQDGAVRVSWEPADIHAEVRVGTGREAPRSVTEGRHGCRGTGSCTIEGLEGPAWLTVFPAGVEELEPLEDVTSVRVRAADSGGDSAEGGGGSEGSGPTDDPGTGPSNETGDGGDGEIDPTEQDPAVIEEETSDGEAGADDTGDGGDGEATTSEEESTEST